MRCISHSFGEYGEKKGMMMKKKIQNGCQQQGMRLHVASAIVNNSAWSKTELSTENSEHVNVR